MRELEARLGEGAWQEVHNFAALNPPLSECDALAILVQFALDRMTVDDRVVATENYNRHGNVTESGTPPVEPIKVLRPLSPRQASHLRGELAAERHHAEHDPLTGLFNRRAAMSLLRYSAVSMVALADVNQFKQINDRWGHHAGDHVLQMVGQRLTTVMHTQTGRVYRLGGDEFLLVWFEPPADRREALYVACQAVAESLEYRGWGTSEVVKVVPSISVGASYVARPARCGPTLLRAADEEMYTAKRSPDSVSLKELHAGG